LKKPKTLTKQVRLAQSLIEQWSDDNFDFSKYEDTYREKVKELINAKVKGREIEVPEEEEEPEVLDLMDALKKSIGQRGRRPVRHRRSA
jgi:DNA end-binding protein Ku